MRYFRRRINNADRKPRRDRDAHAGGRRARPAGAAQAHRFPYRERHVRHRDRRHDRRIADGHHRRALPADQDRRRTRGRPHPGHGRHRRQFDRRGHHLARYAEKAGADFAPVGRSVLQQADAGRLVPAFPRHRRRRRAADGALQRPRPHRRRSRAPRPRCAWRRFPASSASRTPRPTSAAAANSSRRSPWRAIAISPSTAARTSRRCRSC